MGEFEPVCHGVECGYFEECQQSAGFLAVGETVVCEPCVKEDWYAKRQSDTREILALEIVKRDSLTGLPNQLGLDEVYERLSDSTFGVAFIDIKDFGKVNSQLDHDMGDEILVAVAKKLKESVREKDVVAASRIHGDEFVVFFDLDKPDELNQEQGDERGAIALEPKEALDKAVQRAVEGLRQMKEVAQVNRLLHDAEVDFHIGQTIHVPGQHKTLKSLLKQADPEKTKPEAVPVIGAELIRPADWTAKAI